MPTLLSDHDLDGLKSLIDLIKEGRPLRLIKTEGAEIEEYNGFFIRKWEKDGLPVYDTAYE